MPEPIPRTTTLVLRALGIGDLLVAVPALRALRRARPDDRLVLAAPPALAPLVDRVGAVEAVVACDEPADLPGCGAGHPPPALAVNLHGDGTASRRALLATGPRRYVGERVGQDGWGEGGHERERWCRVLAAAGLLPAAEVPAAATDLRLGERRPGPCAPVLVHPGAGYGAKRWPVERFAAVAAALDDGAHPVLVTGSADDRARGAAVVGGARLPADRNRAGRGDLAALVDLVRTAAVVISGDTGVAHLAAAFGVPSVTLFGPVPAARWGPPAGPHRALSHGAARRGDPFAADPDPALLGVGVDEVLAAVGAVTPRSGAGSVVPRT